MSVIGSHSWNHREPCIDHIQFAAKSILLQFKIRTSLDCPDADRIRDLSRSIIMPISSSEIDRATTHSAAKAAQCARRPPETVKPNGAQPGNIAYRRVGKST